MAAATLQYCEWLLNTLVRTTSSVRPAADAHCVQLFDAPRSLADAVSHFLIEGRAQGDHLLVIARASHWQLIRAYLDRRGVDVDDPSERITIVDARKLRTRMMRRGMLDPGRMEETLDGMIGELSSATGATCASTAKSSSCSRKKGTSSRPALLEDYWNHLQQKYRFTLLCGYSAAHFADPAERAPPARGLQPSFDGEVAVGRLARHLADEHAESRLRTASRARINAERLVLRRLGPRHAAAARPSAHRRRCRRAQHVSRQHDVPALSRLHHTVGAMLALTFGDDRQREARARGDPHHPSPRARHAAAACGCFPAGTPYSAEDPALLLWVHATLIESIVEVYERLVTPLNGMERDAYCADSAEVASRSVRVQRTCRDRGRRSRHTCRAVRGRRDRARRSGARACRGAALPGPTARGRAAQSGRDTDRGRSAAGACARGVRIRLEPRRARSFDAAMTALRATRTITPRVIAWWPEARRDL